jgi:nucleoside-diphosphate-sugar epimerase
MENPFLDLDINVSGLLNVLTKCQDLNRDVKIIYLSTRQVYGTPQYTPVDEAHPLNPPDINAVHRVVAEHYLEVFHRAYGIDYCVLRLTNVMGPRMNLNEGFLGKWIDRLRGNIIPVYGDGNLVRDVVYVMDVIDAICLAASRDESSGKTYNVGGFAYCLRTIAEKMIAEWGKGDVIYQDAPESAISVGDYEADWRLINKELGWYPTVEIEEMVKRTLDYYRGLRNERD